MTISCSRRFALSAGVVGAAAALLRSRAGAAEEAKLFRISVAEATRLLEHLRPLHETKRAARPGEWLKEHPEEGQTFAQFLKAHPRRACDSYRRLYLQPLGDFTDPQRRVLALTATCMQRFFGMPVVTSKGISLESLPRRARRVHPTWDVPQVLSTHLLNQVLKPRRPKDAAAVLGLTAADLWPGEGWNFVFGQASLSERVGVWSIYRNGKLDGTEDEQRMFLRRTLKTAMHETGHMFGIPHCIAYECGMNGSNNLQESDRQPLEFCPECQAKIWWTCGARPLARVQELLEFAQQQDLEEEAAFWQRSLERLKTR